MPRANDTIAALATPAGTAAIAVLRISGPDTQAIVAAAGGRTPPPRVATRLNYRDRAGTLLDDVLVTRFEAPRSYTGEDVAEIGCHGNPFIAQKILEDLFARGCRPAEPGEFTQRAFLNGRMDLSQAEAVMDVIHARGERALAAAHDQLRGALGRRINAMVERLLRVIAQVEAYIDFPDEDLPAENRGLVQQEIAGVQMDVRRLAATSHYGRVLRDGIRTAIVGRPNVGKSSLLNRLVGMDRALVSPEPGTTRDYIEERIMVGPHCLRLIDTAGLNPTPAALEELGMERTREQLAAAELVLVVLDATHPELPSDLEPVVHQCEKRVIVVLNKSDLAPPGGDPSLALPCPVLAVSALNGAGVERLTAAISALADSFQTEHGAETIAVSARHATALTAAAQGLEDAAQKLVDHAPAELLASDLRSALNALGEIVGRVDNERVLDELFAAFCIGK